MVKAIVMQELDKIFEAAMAKVPNEFLENVEVTSISDGKRLRVFLGERHCDVDVRFYETRTDAIDKDNSRCDKSEGTRGLPTITVTCDGYMEPSYHSVKQPNERVSELASDIEKQLRFAQSQLEKLAEVSR
jgi:hypothetical protein